MKENLAKLTRYVMIGCGIVSGCWVLVILVYLLIPVVLINIPSKYESRCSPPVSDFSEASLVGTWVAGVPKHNDTLIIKADGTYKQIVHAEPPNFPLLDYEGDWKPWHLEYSDSKIPYLHLTGFAFCGVNSSTPCGVLDNGGYDFCQNKYVPMKGEGILIYLEAPNVSPAPQEPKFYFYLHYPLGSENSYAYRLQAP